MKKLLSLLIAIPVGIVVVTLAVANRAPVTLAVPPQLDDGPLLAATIPLYALIFATLFAGMILGSIATWFQQGRHRKAARTHKVEATKAGFEVERQKEKVAEVTKPNDDESRALMALGLPAPAAR